MPSLNYHVVKTWGLHLAAVLCVFTLPVQWFLIGLVFYFFVMPLFQLIFHDWICHEFCRPRNKVLKILMLLIFYTHDNNIKLKKNYHVFHHKKWLTPDQDPTYRKLQGVSVWRYILGLQNNLDLGIPNCDFSVLESTRLVKWLDHHSRSFYWIWMAMMFVILPFEWFAVVCIFYQWILHCVLCYHDYYLHGPVKNPDRNWAALVFAHATWHYTHHESWQTEYYGPGLWRWINPAWYYRHCFFESCNKQR